MQDTQIIGVSQAIYLERGSFLVPGLVQRSFCTGRSHTIEWRWNCTSCAHRFQVLQQNFLVLGLVENLQNPDQGSFQRDGVGKSTSPQLSIIGYAIKDETRDGRGKTYLVCPGVKM